MCCSAYQNERQRCSARTRVSVRAIVPGWYAYGVDQMLQRIIVTDQTIAGYYQTLDYGVLEKGEGTLRELRSGHRTAGQGRDRQAGSKVTRSQRIPLCGFTLPPWASGGEIVRVEMSTDGARPERCDTAWGTKTKCLGVWDQLENAKRAREAKPLVARASDFTWPNAYRRTVILIGSTYMDQSLLPIEVTVGP